MIEIRKVIEEQLIYTCPHTPPRPAGECEFCKPRIDDAVQKIQSYIDTHYIRKDDVLGMIGEDEEAFTNYYDSLGCCVRKARNQLRQELRDKLNPIKVKHD